MDQFKKWGILLSICFLVFSCINDDDLFELKEDGVISEEEAKILEDCLSSRPFQDTTQLRDKLIGYWQLVGYACGFCAGDIVVPSANITFSQNTGVLRYKDEFEDVELDFKWNVTVQESPSTRRFFLNTEPAHPALLMDVFCEEFIYYNDTPVDGPMFLYQKN